MPPPDRPSLTERLGQSPGAATGEHESAPPRLYAEVAVNATFPSSQTFSYAVPEAIAATPGMAAYVPFGRRMLQGIIVEVTTTPAFSEPEKIRSIRSLIGTKPLLDEARVAAARWIAHEYIAPIFDAVALFLPPGFERKPLTVVTSHVAPQDVEAHALPPRLAETLRAVAERSPITTAELKEHLRFPSVEGAVAALAERGLVQRTFTLARPSVGEKTATMAALAMTPAEALDAIDRHEPRKRSPRADVLAALIDAASLADQDAVRLAGSRANLARLARGAAVREQQGAWRLAVDEDEARSEIDTLTRTSRAARAREIVRALDAAGERPLSDIRRHARADAATVAWLAGIGVLRLRAQHVERDPLAGIHVEPRPPATLLPAQAAALSAICDAIEERRHATLLLHGVTGSGKTEVYLEALARCIDGGGRAIVLVPEIALTPQTVRRFRERFARVAVLHSGLSDGELFDQWHGIAQGRYDVVVGARSAIFAPQPDLRLIVLDEEHEWTYKQVDPQPRYHARSVALQLARSANATVVLGSATPDVETYQRAMEGTYRLLELPERIRPETQPDGSVRPVASAAMPRVDVIDLRDELRAGNRSMFGEALHAAISTALQRQEQVILFLNRRGMAGHVQCRDCGYVPECGSCAVALTYHRQYDRLVCHHCNRRWKLPARCRQCASPRVRLLGAGIEKVEAEAARLFPEARLLRWDRDVTRTRGAHERIMNAFMQREADILIGTQMLAKGLDLPAVTVVGVVNADTALHLPDFRAGERTFQLLEQVAGRAGRGERPGRVFIQTYTPEHYAVDAAARHDYEGFADRELTWRRAAGYPPFARLVQLTLTHPNAVWARDEALRLQRALARRRAEAGAHADVLGPTPAYVPRVRGRWRWQILIRGEVPAALVRGMPLPPHWSVDVDPASLI